MIAHATPLADWVVILPVLLCLIGGAVLLMLRGILRLQGWLCLLVVFSVLVCNIVLFNRVLATGPVSMTMGKWLPPFGISFTADVMGAGFAVVAAFVTFAIVLHLLRDAPESARRDGVFPLVLLLLGGVTGAFLTGDLFNLYVWFEVMLISSVGLMVLAGNPLQLDGAVKYGVLNFLATSLFLLALGLLYGLVGTLNMADIIGAGAKADPGTLAAVAAVFAFAFAIKAAAFPVNAWLPASYHTPPAAISALLGGLLTKVGVYALFRTLLMLWPTARDVLSPTLLVVAVATAAVGPLFAIAETNLRRAVGFILIGGVGVSLLCITGEGVAGGILYVAHAMLTLAALYLIAERVENGRPSSGVSIMFLILILAVAGVPPFLGFWPKLLLLQGFAAKADWWLAAALLLNAFLTLIAGARLWSRFVWQADASASPGRQAIAAAVLLTGAVVMFSLFPGLAIKAATSAAADLADPARYIAAVGLSP